MGFKPPRWPDEYFPAEHLRCGVSLPDSIVRFSPKRASFSRLRKTSREKPHYRYYILTKNPLPKFLGLNVGFIKCPKTGNEKGIYLG